MADAIRCRLVLDPPADGPWNMAVDEAMLGAATAGAAVMRLYRWAEPTLSLGYFQPLAARREHPASAGCPVVRRLSGGGAIVHDDELTYSLALPASHSLSAPGRGLYEAVHGALVEVLAGFGIAARQVEAADVPSRTEPPFLCFSRRAPGDVLVGQAKVAGSAQRRRRGAVIQHGSILLGRSPAAPELPGLSELAGRRVEAERLGEAWLEILRGRLGLCWTAGRIESDLFNEARRLRRDRYLAESWNRRF